ncbi:GIY-YIG nuclease family protein [Caballeronia sp. TF1N1]|uniref:GIY-YIG nuclease family protein n=1 Tax=Caballeronia sp. TF1N1 TaxID=2878153 RepID=UPI001FD0D9A9|nr:GIY-YIG nuclease family protein [Caballeronia sp. TF1N1]
MADFDDDALLEALGVEAAPLKASSHTPREERIIAGFEDILRFYVEHGRAPQHGEDRDIFERLYAVRLDQLRKLPEAKALLADMDSANLLSGAAATVVNVDELDEDALLAELGVSDEPAENDITSLRNVRSYEARRAAEEIANRTRCADFEKFEPLFERVQQEIKAGERKIIKLETRSLDEIQKGTFFVVGGQTAYIAEEKGEFTTDYDRRDMRLRVIYDNGTESEVLQRSFQRALHLDKIARLITEPAVGPLFGDVPEQEDIESGTIYVLRSLSNNPYVAEHREVIHKIGVTGGKVSARVAGASKDATYLLADVEVIAEYKLHNINRARMENLFHRLFGAAQIDLTINDRFGNPVKPKEWFLVPLHVIDEAVKRIIDGTIISMVYDQQTAQLQKAPK